MKSKTKKPTEPGSELSAAGGKAQPTPVVTAPQKRFALAPVVAGAALFLFYVTLMICFRGNGEWLFFDFINNHNVFWGDDAYRYFIARSAWSDPEVYWFNFTLPAFVALDGLLVTLAGNELLVARYLKAAVTVASVFLVYRACLHLQVRHFVAACSALLLGLMPLYFLVGMSFYAEAWMSFLVTAALYLYLSGRLKSAYLVIALMPLVRSEAILFVATAVLTGLWRRDVKAVLIPPSLGFIYFLLILAVGPGLSTFLDWRFEVMRLFQAQTEWYGGKLTAFFTMTFLPWTLGGVLGLYLARRRGTLLFGFPLLAFLAYLVAVVALHRAYLEPRYFAPFLPVLALGFAVFLDRIHGVLLQQRQWAARAAFVALVGGALLYQTMTVEVARIYFRDVFAGMAQGQLSLRPEWTVNGLSRAELDRYREFADVVTRMLHMNPDIKYLVVSNPMSFYFLDPEDIPAGVQVVFSFFSRHQLDPVVGTEVAAGYFPSPPYFSYFSLGRPESGKNLILYLDDFPSYPYGYFWQVGRNRHNEDNNIYLFSGEMREAPQLEVR